MFNMSEMSEFTSEEVMCLTDSIKNNDLYEMDVEVSQFLDTYQNQEGVSVRCLEYITRIWENLQRKYQNLKVLQVDTNKIPVSKKRIRKIKGYKDKKLDRRMKKHKLQLNRLWAFRIFHFLKNKFKKYSDFRKINRLKNKMVATTNIKQLAKVFKQNLWVSKILQKQNDNFLNFINEQKISDQTKLLLFETFDILLEGIKHPDTLVSWDLEEYRNTKESTQLLMKFTDKSFEQIHELALIQYQKQKQLYQTNKCSSHNNISYFWFKYIKNIFESKEFRSIYQSHQIYQRLSLTFSLTATISNIKIVLSVKQLAQYIFKAKIQSKQILSQLMLNYKMNLLNKINMLISLNQFVSAVKDPSTFSRWIR